MDDERTTAVTDTRFVLTLVICLLLAAGYLVLLRLGGTGESTIETRQEVVVRLPDERPSETDPQVVPIDGIPKISNRPEMRK